MKKELMRFSMHSFVDVITNSSSVTYVYAADQAIETAREICESLLKALGLQGTVDDYFEVKLVLNQYGVDRIDTNVFDDTEEFPEAQGLNEEQLDELLDKLIRGEDQRLTKHVGEECIDIVVRSKADPDLDLASQFMGLWNHHTALE
jgi:hypothetical protein